jgi:dTDP-4-dehydrorhamnose reductase
MSHETQRPILVTGVNGQVGAELASLLAPLGQVHALKRSELDLASPENIRQVVQALNPRWIVNPAAYTAVDRAESEPDLAYAINGIAPGILGEEAAKIGAGVYGASKLAGEQALAASGAAHIILRTSWVYGATGKNFLLTILRVAREKQQMSIVADQYGAPTWARDLARLAATILAAAPNAVAAAASQGIYHAAGSGETTWFGFATEAIRQRRLMEPQARFADILPIPTSGYPTPAKRPANSRLDCAKLKAAFGFQFPHWEQSLAEVLAEIPVPHL